VSIRRGDSTIPSFNCNRDSNTSVSFLEYKYFLSTDFWNYKVTATDYQGPVELLGLFSSKNQRALAEVSKNLPDLNIEFTYLLHTLDPVKPTAGPLVLPSVTYDDAKEQFDIILVPGGKT
jgi:putative intracellular protease/amidase